MIVDLTNETISRFLQQESVIEYDIYEMHNKEFLIYFEMPRKNNVSLIIIGLKKFICKHSFFRRLKS
jgi:hypothetical protein